MSRSTSPTPSRRRTTATVRPARRRPDSKGPARGTAASSSDATHNGDGDRAAGTTPGIDRNRGSRVAALAEAFASQTKHLHGVTKTWSKPLRAVAWLVGAGVLRLSGDSSVDGKAGPNAGLSDRLPATPSELAAVVGPEVSRKAWKLMTRVLESLADFQVPVVRAALEWICRPEQAVPVSLPSTQREAALGIAARLAAIAQVAEVLADCGGEEAHIAAVSEQDGALAIDLSVKPGLASELDKVPGRMRLWNRIVPRRIAAVRAVREGAPKPGVTQSVSLAEVGRRILLRQLEQLASRRYGLAYLKDAEFVHEMRVATRRFRAAARVFRKAFEGRLESATQQLRDLADVLGEARDADVFLGFLRAFRNRRGKGHESVLEALIHSQQRHRAACYRRLLRLCLSDRQREMLAGLARKLAAPLDSARGLHTTTKGRKRTAARGSHKALRRTMKTVMDFGPRWQSLSGDEQHQLRIACKKLRYTSEFFADRYPPRLIEMLKPVVQLQDVLGEAHDAEVYLQRLGRHFKEDLSQGKSRRAGHKKRADRAKSSRHAAKALGETKQRRTRLAAWQALGGHLRRRRRQVLFLAGTIWKKFSAARTHREFLAILEAG